MELMGIQFRTADKAGGKWLQWREERKRKVQGPSNGKAWGLWVLLSPWMFSLRTHTGGSDWTNFITVEENTKPPFRGKEKVARILGKAKVGTEGGVESARRMIWCRHITQDLYVSSDYSTCLINNRNAKIACRHRSCMYHLEIWHFVVFDEYIVFRDLGGYGKMAPAMCLGSIVLVLFSFDCNLHITTFF